jgi:hypothetical protein
MAKGRMISKDASTDPDLNAMSLEAELLFLLTLPHLDRDGLIHGDPVILWAQAAPRRLELLDRTPSLIQEWENAGMVARYNWKNGAILFFPNFRKHNAHLDYDHDTPSRFPPPPGYTRGAKGLIPKDPQLAANIAASFDVKSFYRAELLAVSQQGSDVVGTRLRKRRNKVAAQDQHQDQDQSEVQSDDDDEGAASLDFDLDNETTAETARTIAKSIAVNMDAWAGSAKFIDNLTDHELIACLTWLWLWDIAHDPYDDPYLDRNPFKGVKNPVGKIIKQSQLANVAPLFPRDRQTLIAAVRGEEQLEEEETEP